MPGRFLLILWSGGGNVNPFLALGAQLAAGGHAVRVLGPADLAARFEADGLAYHTHPSFDEWAAAAPDVEKSEAWARGLVAEILAEVNVSGPTSSSSTTCCRARCAPPRAPGCP
jgi:UDP:flavonoid glycosyltransferase YjiC (YdhE family)